MNNSTANKNNTVVLPEIKEEVVPELGKKLIVYNDDHNTFEWVIITLIELCKHSIVQAEQCAYLIHHKGKCSVKSGSLDELKPLKDGLVDRGLSAVIE